MFNIARVLQDVVRRVSLGETVRVKMEYRDEVSEELEKSKIAYVIEDDPTNATRVLFRVKKQPTTPA
jgi:hypothetical protein